MKEVIENPVAFRGGMLKVIREEHGYNKLISLSPYDSISIRLKFLVDEKSFYPGKRPVCIYAWHRFQQNKSRKKHRDEIEGVYGGSLQSDKFTIDVKESSSSNSVFKKDW
ncbi:MAG: hypothetical protein AB2L24_08555 [Mangrovibacterium sp.]